MTGLLEGKKLLITGVITEASIAFHTARIAQEQGAQVVLTGFGRLRLVERIASRLPVPAPVIELDVTNQEHLDGLSEKVAEHLPHLDGVLHSIGYAPPSCLADPYLDVPWEDVSVAVHTSAYSLKALAKATLPLLGRGSSIVGMDFDARVAWSSYNWMGFAKAALENCAKYLAKELGPEGIRVNLVAAGPLETMAAKSIPGYHEFSTAWQEAAPLGWDVTDREPAAKAVCALLSDWFPATTGSMVMVDGGAHAIGA
ncbi:enoyl-[acyl-carrier protein] reductase I [Crossiella equi]|uniref:Enoyl-[acyl-carrier-protein] reductase [NADH] n=1 Tax=Crossiella equi TaxID=130796 RepID=A0ABS5A5Z4_9PSEU|nr:enoyl-ACP reductase FabI [Crossiella equi]MBP2472005.1 enoyl-[acyl-carrier protein] reductase I [Crossiella equi]